MNRTLIKICGITRPEDGIAAASAGADCVGLVFWKKSKRAVDVVTAAKITASVPDSVQRVGVFVDPSAEDVMLAVREANLSMVQISGDVTVGDWNEVARHVTIIQSIPLTDDKADLSSLRRPGIVHFLVDSATPGNPGGTGQSFDWSRVEEVRPWGHIWLAGGLNAANVGTAIATVRPYAVDVSTGVEDAPGMKSPAKIREFIEAVRTADRITSKAGHHAR